MPVYSMTGFASVQGHAPAANADGSPTAQPPVRMGLEIRSVNSRFLDLVFRLPEELRQLEPVLRELVSRAVKRGKVEVRASLDATDSAGMVSPSPQTLQRIASLQSKVQDWMPDARSLSVADILRMSASSASHAPVEEAVWTDLARQAVQSLLGARAREGERLANMLLGHIEQLHKLAEQAGPLVPQLVEQQRLRFLERWKDALAAQEGQVSAEAAQDRALSEATAFAIRIDVAEELTRLRAHLDEIARLLKKGGDVGKRLDFLIQELHREANTMGSKSAMLEVTRISVDMKVLIEQMREQVQNIE